MFSVIFFRCSLARIACTARFCFPGYLLPGNRTSPKAADQERVRIGCLELNFIPSMLSQRHDVTKGFGLG
ncbi:MAG: hypothetical protein D3910_19670, partial [Candidatus Electrothrix sp. ATG2]|nr:hypothetical protein [Candidatus Electrothrix sp. ATG2]